MKNVLRVLVVIVILVILVLLSWTNANAQCAEMVEPGEMILHKHYQYNQADLGTDTSEPGPATPPYRWRWNCQNDAPEMEPQHNRR